MPILDRSQIKEPVLPKETVEVPALGGEVVVRGLLLSERLELSTVQRKLGEPLPGELIEDAKRRAGARLVPITLARAVVLSDGEPMWSATQWEQFGSQHFDAAWQLFDVAMRLSGNDLEAAEKN